MTDDELKRMFDTLRQEMRSDSRETADRFTADSRHQVEIANVYAAHQNKGVQSSKSASSSAGALEVLRPGRELLGFQTPTSSGPLPDWKFAPTLPEVECGDDR